MTRIIESLDQAAGYDALLCDLWGCYHNGVTPHAGAVAALQGFRARGGVVALLTNAPRPDFSTLAQLGRMGAPADSWDVIVTSGDATVEAVNGGRFGARCHHIGPERDLDLFRMITAERVALEDADYILCSGLTDDATETPGDYADLIAAGVARGLTMVCANPDVVVDRGEKRLYCGGALAEVYSEAGGDVRLFGKPHRPIYDLALRKLEQTAGRTIPKKRILAVGDGPQTDVKGAADHGFDALFVAGGLAAEAVLDGNGAIEAQALAAYAQREKIAPEMAIAFLS